MKKIFISNQNFSLFLKAKRLGWKTLFTGDGIICMFKRGVQK